MKKKYFVTLSKGIFLASENRFCGSGERPKVYSNKFKCGFGINDNLIKRIHKIWQTCKTESPNRAERQKSEVKRI